jgi:hypothetical protein
MTRTAFVFGSNGPSGLSPLTFAAKDAVAFAEQISRPQWGFRSVRPLTGAPSGIRDELFDAAESCTEGDVFVCYFAGHAILDRGHLYLLLDNSNTTKLLSSCLPVSDLTHALSRCRATKKLLILDCCHAEGAVSTLGLRSGLGTPLEELAKPDESYIILFASGRLGRARELEYLGGGFLTQSICSAMTSELRSVSPSRRLKLDELNEWLTRRARDHNRRHPAHEVPVPSMFGSRQGEFALADSVPACVHRVLWPDGSVMVLLPFRTGNCIWHISQAPVTNAQYRKFVGDTGFSPPAGEHWTRSGIRKRWVDGFVPWNEARFCDDEKPVVCVNQYDAIGYCEWVSRTFTAPSRTVLPPLALWNGAARVCTEGTDETIVLPLAHQKSECTERVDRPNVLELGPGIRDLFGNVWEWTEAAKVPSRGRMALVAYDDSEEYEEYTILRGGGFLDDLTKVDLTIRSTELRNGRKTRHSDLGFRIATAIEADSLPPEVRVRAETFDTLDVRTVRIPATA